VPRRILVVGAGLSGLVAARTLTAAGHDVTVLDKGRGVGGRLATRRIGDAVLDHGAQFFTVRSDEFASMVNSWVTDGVAHEWCRGFSGDDGQPRYVGSAGMTGIAKHLARGLDVRTSHLAFSLEQNGAAWTLTTDDGAQHSADAVVLTAPLPQSFSLMFSAGLEMPDDLRTIDYDRTLGLLALVDSNRHNIAAPGGMQDPDGVFSFIADNRAKGVSGEHALTFHANPAWSLEHFDLLNDEIHSRLLAAAQPWLGDARVLESQPKKWRFATPQRTWPDACWVHDSGSLVLAGDAFAGPRMEGAALSGLAAARALS
jgi:hypothetical protein